MEKAHLLIDSISKIVPLSTDEAEAISDHLEYVEYRKGANITVEARLRITFILLLKVVFGTFALAREKKSALTFSSRKASPIPSCPSSSGSRQPFTFRP